MQDSSLIPHQMHSITVWQWKFRFGFEWRRWLACINILRFTFRIIGINQFFIGSKKNLIKKTVLLVFFKMLFACCKPQNKIESLFKNAFICDRFLTNFYFIFIVRDFYICAVFFLCSTIYGIFSIVFSICTYTYIFLVNQKKLLILGLRNGPILNGYNLFISIFMMVK